MKVSYDKKVDALYIQLSEAAPDGVSEVKDGINIDLTKDDKIAGIEILDASKKMDIKTLCTYIIDEDSVKDTAWVKHNQLSLQEIKKSYHLFAD